MNLQVLTPSLRQFAVFSAIGVLNTLIHYGVFYALLNGFGIHYLVSSGIGYGCGLVNSYLLNRKFTFRVARGRNISEFGKFVIVNIVALSVNLVLMKALVDVAGLRPEIAQVFAIVGSLAANFAGNKAWTFKA
ncbi:MAG: GtrA family protein [Desulfobacterales bacterium]